MFGRWLLRRGLMIFRDKQRIRRWLYYRAADGAIAAVAGSVTAFVVSTPLVAYHFGLFSPWAALLSVVLAVPVTLVLVPAYLSMALAWPMPSLSDWLGRLAAAAADGLATMVGWLQHLPALSLDVRPVSAWWVVLCYAVLACVLLRRRLPLGLAASVGLGAILAAVTVVSQLPAAAPGVAEVHVLDVGPGQCVLVRAPSGQSCMIDAGTRSGFDAGELTLRPFLRAMRFGQPRTLFVSHANTDHYNAMLAMLRQGGIHQVCVGEHFAAAAAVGVEAKAFLDAVSRAGAELKVLRRGDVVRLDERTRVEVLGPPPGATIKNVNDTSLVLRLVCDDKSMLFPGDAEDAGQSAAMAEPGALASDVLLMPHHGGWGRRLPEFVAAVRPGWVVVSAAQDPQGPSERAARAFYSRLHSGYRYFSTAHNGWCAISLGGGRVDVQTMR
jgi:competence protein ComEC